MIYISEVVGKKVWDVYGSSIGKCEDVLVGASNKPFPSVVALQIMDTKNREILVNAKQISSLFPSIVLSVPKSSLDLYKEKGNELRLKKQILDHQIVDVEGRRVVRVNDIQLAFSKNEYVVTGVDRKSRTASAHWTRKFGDENCQNVWQTLNQVGYSLE